jgi:hypothetical protein
MLRLRGSSCAQPIREIIEISLCPLLAFASICANTGINRFNFSGVAKLSFSYCVAGLYATGAGGAELLVEVFLGFFLGSIRSFLGV